ncbi:extracellular solute-binding protein [Paenibacillus frigoriresistens]|uniref:ABC transporter substrate-binding protein n=1 Tax=Paenibacillus alginolyticus TaxID=59839 RepID=UPI00156742B4|nr:extracellular solute-binding protein [Paenibacillus frigoriresistens]NRF95521.1 extracellular solute-binding protein [Paenibacillus frigoriresistens]
MSKLKKAMSVPVVFSLVFAAAGCSSPSNNASSNATPASGSTTAPTTQSADASKSGEQSNAKKTKLIFWDKSEYVKEYNDSQKERVAQFSKEFNVDVEYVAIPPADLKTKLLAAVEAGNPPDLLLADDFVAKQFVGNNQLVEISDILKKYDFREDSKKYAYALEGWYEVPVYHNPNVMYVRKDKVAEKNLELPKTWDDVKKVAKAINDPKNNFYGLGFQLGGGGDSNGRIENLIRTFGTDLVDKDGKVTVNTPEALEAIKYDTSFFTEKLTPPGAVTGDDSWNNTAYLNGQVGIIFNSSSVYAAMRKEKPELLNNTQIMPWPAGPKRQFGSGGGTVFVMFNKGKNIENAKKYIDYFFNKDFYGKLIEKLNGLAVPVLNGFENTEFWQKPENKGWFDASKNIVPLGDPGPPDARASQVISEYILPKAVQSIVVNNVDPKKALDEIEKNYKRVYEKK